MPIVPPQQIVQLVVDSHDDVAITGVDHATVSNYTVLSELEFSSVQRQDILGRL